jgi:hypothetical protein
MIANMKNYILPLSIALLLALPGCKLAKPAKPSAAQPAATVKQEIPQRYQALIHGAWEGTLGEPWGYQMRFDCFATGNTQKALVSVTSETWNSHFILANYQLEGNSLTFWYNDGAQRAEIKFQFGNGGQLTGTFTQYGLTASGVFKKTSSTPTDGEYHVKPQENLIRLLRESSDFSHADASRIEFEYDYSHPSLAELKTKYGLEAIAGTGDTQSKAIKLLNWLCAGTSHKGDYDNHVEKNGLALLEYTYNNGPEKGLNCYNLSIVLSEMYLSLGIQARALWLMPKNSNDMDNHVVVMVWLPEMGKWIMLDPSFNSYFLDANGNVLGPLETRKAIASAQSISLNQDAKHTYIGYLNYMAKDMCWFYSNKKSAFGAFGGQRDTIYLCPADFDLNEWSAKNMRYRNSMLKAMKNEELSRLALSDEELATREDDIRKEKYTFATPASFWEGKSASQQGQSVSGDTLIADFKYLVKTLEETHPDPYSGFGGKVFFHKSAFLLEQQLKKGATLNDFRLLLSSFLAQLQDGHTYVSQVQPPNKDESSLILPINFMVIQNGLIVTQIPNENKKIIGSKLLKINEIPIAKLCSEAGKIESLENLYGQYGWLAKNIISYRHLKRILPELKEKVTLDLESVNGTVRRIELSFIDTNAIQPKSMASAQSRLVAPSSQLNYSYLDKNIQAMYIRISTIMARECFMHMKQQNGDNFTREELDDFYSSFLKGREFPEDVDKAIAGVPGFAETFRQMLEKMKSDGAKHLIIDLRSNHGGWTDIVYPSLYMLYGNDFFAKQMRWDFRRLISPLLMKKWNTTLEDFNKANNSSYQFGDYNFSVGSGEPGDWLAMRRDAFWRYNVLGDASESINDIDGRPVYTPQKLFVITDENSFSAAFHYAYLLWEMGATVVGVPSAQAPNSFMENTRFELPSTKLVGSISNTFQQIFPHDDRRTKIFYPDIMLDWKDHEKYNFDTDSVLLYLLDHLNLRLN